MALSFCLFDHHNLLNHTNSSASSNFEDRSQWISVRGYTTRHFPAVRQRRCPLPRNSSWRKDLSFSLLPLLSPTGPPLARHKPLKVCLSCECTGLICEMKLSRQFTVLGSAIFCVVIFSLYLMLDHIDYSKNPNGERNQNVSRLLLSSADP